MNELEILFQKYTGAQAGQCTELTASGSNRRYFRLEAENIVLIGVEGTSVDENRAFIAMSEHFAAKSLPVPKVLAKSDTILGLPSLVFSTIK